LGKLPGRHGEVAARPIQRVRVNHVLLLVLTIGGDGERSARHHEALKKDWQGLAEARLPQTAASAQGPWCGAFDWCNFIPDHRVR
jgi:hypothetical protein